MFFFGDPEQTLQLYWENQLSKQGPGVADCYYDEMSEKELKDVFAYLYMTYSQALEDGVEDEVLVLIRREYDTVFQLMAEVVDGFRQRVDQKRHVFLPDHSKENINKYRKLAGLPVLA